MLRCAYSSRDACNTLHKDPIELSGTSERTGPPIRAGSCVSTPCRQLGCSLTGRAQPWAVSGVWHAGGEGGHLR